MAERDAWERWKRGWQHVFFGVLLAVHVARDGMLSTGSTGGSLLQLAILAVLVGWYVACYGPWPARSRSITVPYLIGATGAWVALIILDPAFWIAGVAVLVPLCMRHAAMVAFVVAICGAMWLAYRTTSSDIAWPETVTSVLTVGAGIACLGYIAVLDREGRKRARLLDELAAAQAELAAAERRAGTLAERQRLAREVHDTVTQGFASIAMLLEAVQEKRDGRRTDVDQHVAAALRIARDNLAESRRLVWALQPAQLDGTSLPDAVRRQTDQLTLETGITASTTVTGDPTALHADTEAGILRVVQEALTNATRHSKAAEITVTLSYLPDVVLVDVADDGVGLPGHRPRTGLGMRTMRQRADELGGVLTIESEPGEGTTVALAAPVRRTETPGQSVSEKVGARQ